MTIGTQLNMAIAGLSLDRPVKAAAVWSPPVVAVEENFLVYDAGPRATHTMSQGLLRGLLKARESREETIKFCQRWGVLGLCDHGIPRSHSDQCVNPGAPIRTEVIKGIPHLYYRESIDSVQRFASALESLLGIGAEMAQGRKGKPDDWDLACDVITGPDFPPWPRNPASSGVSEARTYLQVLMRRLIQICRIRPRFWWNGATGSWQIDLDSDGGINLPALVVIELIVAIGGKEGFAMCSSCHRAYIPLRRPDPNRRNYCQSCGRSAACRDASRDKRERQRKERRKDSKHAKA